MSRNAILARIKLTPNNTILAKRSTDLLTNLSYRTIGVDYSNKHCQHYFP